MSSSGVTCTRYVHNSDTIEAERESRACTHVKGERDVEKDDIC